MVQDGYFTLTEKKKENQQWKRCKPVSLISSLIYFINKGMMEKSKQKLKKTKEKELKLLLTLS